MRLARTIIACAWIGIPALGLLSPGRAEADEVVYTQPPLFPDTLIGWNSTFDQDALGDTWKVYDSFSLGETATIQRLTWQGFTFDGLTLGGTSTPVASFKVEFYGDGPGGEPGVLLYADTIGYSQSAVATIDYFGNGDPQTLYDYAGTLSGGFTAVAGTTYWLSIQAITSLPAYWGWMTGSGGDGTALQTLDPQFGGGQFVRDYDMTFSLIAAPVPEPSSLALGGIGAATLLGLAARRRKAAATGIVATTDFS